MGTKKRQTRRISHTYSYGPFLRISDRLAGIRDRDVVADAEKEHAVNTPFVVRMAATYAELDHSRLAAARDAARPFVQELEEAVRLIRAIDEQITEALHGVEAAKSSPLREKPNGGEVHMTSAMVQVRAVREHDSGVARAESVVSDLQRRRAGLAEREAALRGELIERFTMSAEESRRHCAFFNRRLGTYARLARMTAHQTPQLPLADWVSDQGLWFPQQIEASEPKALPSKDQRREPKSLARP